MNDDIARGSEGDGISRRGIQKVKWNEGVRERDD